MKEEEFEALIGLSPHKYHLTPGLDFVLRESPRTCRVFECKHQETVHLNPRCA